MFSQACVCPQGGCLLPGGCLPGPGRGLFPGGYLVLGGFLVPEMPGSRGVCSEGVPGPGGDLVRILLECILV